MGEAKDRFLGNISLYFDLERLAKYSYIDTDDDFYHHILDATLLENNSILKEKFASNFYTGFCNCIIKSLFNHYDFVLDQNYFLEEKICEILIDIIGKDIVMEVFFNCPNKIVFLLESIDYKHQNLLEFINSKISTLSRCFTSDINTLVNNPLSIDIIEAISDCSVDLHFNNKKLMR